MNATPVCSCTAVSSLVHEIVSPVPDIHFFQHILYTGNSTYHFELDRYQRSSCLKSTTISISAIITQKIRIQSIIISCYGPFFHIVIFLVHHDIHHFFELCYQKKILYHHPYDFFHIKSCILHRTKWAIIHHFFHICHFVILHHASSWVLLIKPLDHCYRHIWCRHSCCRI